MYEKQREFIRKNLAYLREHFGGKTVIVDSDGVRGDFDTEEQALCFALETMKQGSYVIKRLDSTDAAPGIDSVDLLGICS